MKKGFKRAVYAIMTNDTLETYGVVKEIPLGVKLDVSPKVAEGKFHAYDVLAEQDTEFSEADVTIEIGELTKQLEVDLLGYQVDGNGAVLSKGDSRAPWVAIGYQVPLSGGRQGYMWLLKGKFGLPNETNATKTDNFTYGTDTMAGKFAARLTDGLWKTRAVTGDLAVENWFNAPYIGVPLPNATNKSTLEASIVQARGLKESSYTSGFPAVKTKLAAAVTVFDNKAATQKQIDVASGELLTAIATLV